MTMFLILFLVVHMVSNVSSYPDHKDIHDLVSNIKGVLLQNEERMNFLEKKTQKNEEQMSFLEKKTQKIQTLENENERLKQTLEQVQHDIQKLTMNVTNARELMNANRIMIQSLNVSCCKEPITTLIPTAITTTPTPSIQTRWIYKYGASSYYWSKNQGIKSSWYEAKAWCEAMGGGSQFVKVESSRENTYLKSVVGRVDTWMGASDIKSEGTFRWTDDSSMDFADWSRWEPSTGNQGAYEDCVHFNRLKNGHWNDYSCHDLKYFICEREVHA